MQLAPSRRAALALLRRGSYAAVLVDTSSPAAEVTTSEDLWRNAGSAVPLELSLKDLNVSGSVRLLRHVLEQCEQAKESARQAGASALEEKLRSALTGLLLQSELLLRDSAAFPALEDRARQLQRITHDLRGHFH